MVATSKCSPSLIYCISALTIVSRNRLWMDCLDLSVLIQCQRGALASDTQLLLFVVSYKLECLIELH